MSGSPPRRPPRSISTANPSQGVGVSHDRARRSGSLRHGCVCRARRATPGRPVNYACSRLRGRPSRDGCSG
jgi:hypothetical protein